MVDKKRWVALSSVAASGSMTVLKLIVGLLTGSLGILSEAIHSLLDLASATMTFFAVRAADQPADEHHPYGHGKIEALSALGATVLLVLTSFWIMWEAVHRLTDVNAVVEVRWYAVALILLVIVVDIGRSRALLKVARETGSQALEADALHYTSDILSSSAVLVGLGLAWFGWPKGDAVAALVVAVVVLGAAWHLGRAAVDVLIDAAPEGVAEKTRQALTGIEGVVGVERVRVRQAGAVVFIEAVLKVSRALSLAKVNTIRETALSAVHTAIPNADIMIQAEALVLDTETAADTVRAVAAQRGLTVHDIDLAETSGQEHLSLDIELDEELTIREAHDIASALEADLRRDLGCEVDTHIDSRNLWVRRGRQMEGEEVEPIQAIVERIAREFPPVLGVHKLRVSEMAKGLRIVFHCTFDSRLPLREAHLVAAQMERRIQQDIPRALRIVVHTEPDEHDDAPVLREAAV